jgi:outer membrane protein
MCTFRSRIIFFLTPLFVISGLAQSTTSDAAPLGLISETITLSEAIQRALAKNFSIKVSEFDAAIASARVTEALGKFDPVLSGSYTYSERYDPYLRDTLTGARPAPDFIKRDEVEAGIGGLLPWGMTYRLGANSTNARGAFGGLPLTDDNYDTFAGVSGTLPLLRNFGFGPTLASIRIAQANRGISHWQFRADVIDTVTAVIFAYNDLNFAYANLRSAVRSRELAASLLDENEKRFRVGSMSQFDVDSARSRVANREEGILFAERSVRVAENALKQLITDEKTPALLNQRILVEALPPAPIVLVDAAADFRIALQKRPDYQQANLALNRDTVNARYQRNQLLPRIDAVGSYGYAGYDRDDRISRQQIRHEDNRDYRWGVVVSVPLTFTTERGRYRAAKLQQRRSETTVDQVEQDIVVRVGNAADQIETTQKRIRATREARDLAQATLDAEVKRLRAGQSSTFFVLQQQEILSSLEVSASRAQSDYHKALADYDRQLGVTLEKLNISIDPPR